jgi:hypothetical protein
MKRIAEILYGIIQRGIELADGELNGRGVGRVEYDNAENAIRLGQDPTMEKLTVMDGQDIDGRRGEDPDLGRISDTFRKRGIVECEPVI